MILFLGYCKAKKFSRKKFSRNLLLTFVSKMQMYSLRYTQNEQWLRKLIYLYFVFFFCLNFAFFIKDQRKLLIKGCKMQRIFYRLRFIMISIKYNQLQLIKVNNYFSLFLLLFPVWHKKLFLYVYISYFWWGWHFGASGILFSFLVEVLEKAYSWYFLKALETNTIFSPCGLICSNFTSSKCL